VKRRKKNSNRLCWRKGLGRRGEQGFCVVPFGGKYILHCAAFQANVFKPSIFI